MQSFKVNELIPLANILVGHFCYNFWSPADEWDFKLTCQVDLEWNYLINNSIEKISERPDTETGTRARWSTWWMYFWFQAVGDIRAAVRQARCEFDNSPYDHHT